MVKIGKKTIILYILFLFCLISQSIEVKLFSDQREVVKGQTFQFYIQVEGNFSKISKPELNISDEIKVLGTGTSRSTNIINWETSYVYKYIYTAVSKEEGEFDVGPAVIEIDSKKYKTGNFSLKVVKPGNVSKDVDKNSNYIAYQEFNKKEYYVGEKIDYKIVFATADSNVRGLSINESENITDFIKGEVKDDRTRKRINGKIYEVIMLTYPLVALKSGDYNFDDVFFTFDRPVKKRGRNNFFNDSFFGNDDFFSMFDVDWKKTTVICDSAEIKIKDIPEPPANYSQGVGKFIISSKVQDGQFKKGVPLTFSVLISGAGNLDSVEKPVFLSKDEYSVSFSGEKKFNNSNTGSGERQFDFIVIPEKKGNIIIDSVEFTYFDIEKENFITVKTSPIEIEVEENKDYVKVLSKVDDYSNNNSVPMNKIKDEDIEYIFFKEKYNKNNSAFLLKIIKIINIVLFSIVLFFLLIRTIIERFKGRKNKVIDRAISELNKSYKKGDFYKDFQNIFWRSIKEVKDLNVDVAGNLIIEELRNEIPETILKDLEKLNHTINFYAYAGAGLSEDSTSEILEKALKVLKFFKSKEGRKI